MSYLPDLKNVLCIDEIEFKEQLNLLRERKLNREPLIKEEILIQP